MWKSSKQEKWAHTEAGQKKLGKKTVNEFDQASKGMKLPEAPLPMIKSNRYTDLMKKPI